MPDERSSASAITGEKAEREKAMSISLQTWPRLAWMTASVIGSRVLMPGLRRHLRHSRQAKRRAGIQQQIRRLGVRGWIPARRARALAGMTAARRVARSWQPHGDAQVADLV